MEGYLRGMKKTVLSPLWLFTFFFLGAMFLPRLAPQGLFGDGLLYASMARNLAISKGSMWAPWFSSGYWLDFASGAPYFENPPLMIWFQAGFFWLLGDHWWVEKCYALLVFCLNAWLIVRIWETPLRQTPLENRYGWVPLLFWYLITPVIWGNPNNLMDNNLATFCLLALWAALDGLFSGRGVWIKLTLAGALVYLGILTKGPVALYPAAVPFLFACIGGLADGTLRKKVFRGLAQSAWIGVVGIGLFALMLYLVPESQHYFEQYWQRRLGVVLSGVREDAELSGWARLYILVILVKEQPGLIAVFLLLLFLARGRNIDGQAFRRERRISLLFLLLGLSATLPIALSARQNGIYVIPGMPMFALAAAYFHLPVLHYWLAEPGAKTRRFLTRLGRFSFVAMFFLAVYVVMLFGQPGRDKDILHDLPGLQQAIPAGSQVAVCERLMYNQQVHAYLQRFHRLELTRDLSLCHYALTDQTCDTEMFEALKAGGFSKNTAAADPKARFMIWEKNR